MSANVALKSEQKKLAYFTSAQLSQVDFSRIPKHIAIIPDGNRRWARKRLESIYSGHEEGADTLIEIVKAAQELTIQEITFYSFSTENWNRSTEEIQALMMLFNLYLSEQCENMISSDIKVDVIGDISSLPLFLQETLHKTREATQHCQTITLILAMNYGSRNEICRAVQSILIDYDKQLIDKEKIDESLIARYLDTHKWKDPDLLIRTSGELRVSNFLLWQISYAEIYISPVLWPDFTPLYLLNAVLDYQHRERRWGGA